MEKKKETGRLQNCKWSPRFPPKRQPSNSAVVTAELHWVLELLISTSPLGSRVTLFWASHPPGVGSASRTDELGRAHMSGEPGSEALNVNSSPSLSSMAVHVCATTVCFHLAVRWTLCQRSSRGSNREHSSPPLSYNRNPTTSWPEWTMFTFLANFYFYICTSQVQWNGIKADTKIILNQADW